MGRYTPNLVRQCVKYLRPSVFPLQAHSHNTGKEDIYSSDLTRLLTTHEVTWSREDRFCADQYVNLRQPEEFPTAPVQSRVTLNVPPPSHPSFEKFNFDKGGIGND